MPSAIDELSKMSEETGQISAADADHQQQQHPLYVMNSLADQTEQRYFSNESLEETSSNDSGSNVAHRKDHEFIPTRMKTINASKPAADPKQFTRIPSNPLLVSAQKQMMQVEEVKKKKEVIKRGDDEPDWQFNLSSWKDKRRKQSEEALQRVAEVKALESTDGDDFSQRQKISIGRKLSSLLYTNGEEDWSDLGLEKNTSGGSKSPPLEANKSPDRTAAPTHSESPLPRTPVEADVGREEKAKSEDRTELVINASRAPWGGYYGEGVPVLNRKTSAPVLPYGSAPGTSESPDGPPSVRRKSTELSNTMRSRLEAFTNIHEENNRAAKSVEPDETFREKLQTFRKISEPGDDDRRPKGPKPPLSYKTLIGTNFSQSQTRIMDHDDSKEEEEQDSVDQLLDDALEESYRSVLEEEADSERAKSGKQDFDTGDFLARPRTKSPPREKPPPPPPSNEETVKNRRNLQRGSQDEELDKQEQEIIASLEMEEREHKKYMETVNAMRNMSPGSPGASQSQQSPPSQSGSTSSYNRIGGAKSISPTPYRGPSPGGSDYKKVQPSQTVVKKKSDSGQRNYNQQHWLIQEAEQRRMAEQQRPSSSSGMGPPHQSPVYENSAYLGGGVPTQTQQFTNHQRLQQQHLYPTQPPVVQPPPPQNENMYANLGHQQQYPTNFQREAPALPRGLPGPQVPPRGQPDLAASAGNTNDRLLSVSGKKKCSHCKEELGRGAAMIIESLRLFYHLRCFRCVVCNVQLGNGAQGTDVRVRNNKLHCQNCYSNDEGLKFSKV